MPIDVAWAAGLLEGEACFDIRPSQCVVRDPNNKQVRIIVEMKDEDVLIKLRNLFGGTVNPVKCPSKIRDNWNPYYKWLLSSQQDIKICLEEILPYMSKRRTVKIKEILDFIERKSYENCSN